MMKVNIPNNFIPERTYAIRTLLTNYCGVPVSISIKEGISAYELVWEEKSITIADEFFGKAVSAKTYLDTKYLPDTIVSATSPGYDGILILYGKEHLETSRDSIKCGVDLFAGVFFMLTRWEEALASKRDLHNRFPASEAAVVKAGYILRPLVDEYSQLLRNWLLAFGYSMPERSSSYAVVPTCDVDIPYYWRSKPVWKTLGGRLLNHWNLIETLKEYSSFKAVQSQKEKDPYDTFDYLMTLAEKNGTRFQFNFLAGGTTKYEGYYLIDDSDIKALIAEIQSRGHAIGIHPSYATFLNGSMIQQEKQALEKSTGAIISTSRQHYLRFAVPETWKLLAEAGISVDSTLGYAAEPGFRCGTCKPFPVFDIQQREQLPLIERPLLIMDVSFRMYKKLSIAESIRVCDEIKRQVKKHNGELVILWHNSNLSEIDGWDGWKEVLENLMV
ncbi:MAG: polysaccharide deacetylase family protein [Saprospiraceae bacterium]|nr:polysaccharide deacetylase family protein [Saprospiraceae bacterium]